MPSSPMATADQRYQSRPSLKTLINILIRIIAEDSVSRILDLIGRIRGDAGIYQVKAAFMPL